MQLRVPHHEEWLDHRNVLRHVKLHLKNRHWLAWCAKPDQGKTARVHGGVGSAFLTRPRGMWESDYRFAVAARLNVVDTVNTLSRRRLRAHDRCRYPACRWKETLAHVLNHCPGTMDAVRGRHDDALKEIEHTLRASSGDRRELRVNQTTWLWRSMSSRVRTQRARESQVRGHQGASREPGVEGSSLGHRVRLAWVGGGQQLQGVH
eukprot:jgi/Phyca11/133576/e_gw1.569.1.1